MSWKNKKIFYIVNNRIPTEKAHGLQIIKTCEALASFGNNVKLVIPTRKNFIKQSVFDFYNVSQTFSVKKLFSMSFNLFGKFGFIIQQIFFALRVVFLKISPIDVIYSRDEFSLYFLSFFHKNIFYEAHDNKWNFFARRVFKKSAGIVSITFGLKDFYVKKGILADRILVSPDGVDLNDFGKNYDKNNSRKKFNLPQDKKIILYTGHLYGWKGVYTLADSAKFFNKNTVFVFVGGTEKDVGMFRDYCKNFNNILIMGNRPHSEIPEYLACADVLVIPNSAKSDISKYYTSPIKLFEYMASGVPIIASDLPSIREVLDKNNASFFESDSPQDLAENIKKLLENVDFANNLSEQAKKDVLKYTWQKRAEAILNFIQNDKR